MERVPRGVYTKEFKEEAVRLVTEAGLSVPEAAVFDKLAMRGNLSLVKG